MVDGQRSPLDLETFIPEKCGDRPLPALFDVKAGRGPLPPVGTTTTPQCGFPKPDTQDCRSVSCRPMSLSGLFRHCILEFRSCCIFSQIRNGCCGDAALFTGAAVRARTKTVRSPRLDPTIQTRMGWLTCGCRNRSGGSGSKLLLQGDQGFRQRPVCLGEQGRDRPQRRAVGRAF